MTRDQALEFIRDKVPTENLIKHMIATEAVMRALATKLDHDVDEWGLAGLVHDCDLGVTEGAPERHGKVGAQMLRDAGESENLCRAVAAHAGHSDVEAHALLEKALIAADQVTGLITAAALIHPSKSIAALKVKSLKKRMKEKRFAAGVRREDIRSCAELGIELEDFLALSAAAMGQVSSELGL